MVESMQHPDNYNSGPEQTSPTSYLDNELILSAVTSAKNLTGVNREQEFKPSSSFYVAILALSLTALAAAFTTTSLSIALPVTAEKLHASTIQAFWAPTSYCLTSTVFQPVFASASDIFGRKWMLVTAIVFFLTGSIVSAIAQHISVLLVGRSFQGVGGGGIIVLTEVIVTDIVPLRLRGQWFGLINMMWALGTSTGPVIGGIFAEKSSWRGIYWLNVPIAGLAVPLVLLAVNIKLKHTSIRAQLRTNDWFGALLFIASSTGLLFALSCAGIMYTWSSWNVIMPLILCGVGLLVFVLYEYHIPSQPFLRLRVFCNETAALNYISAFVQGMIIWTVVYYLPLYCEIIRGSSPIQTGVSLFPMTFTLAPSAFIGGVIISKTGHYRWGLWVGWLLTTVGAGMTCFLDVHSGNGVWIIVNLLLGVGSGTLLPATAFAIQGSAAAVGEDMGSAIATYSFLRAFGSAIGGPLTSVIFQNSIKRNCLTFPPLAANASRYSSQILELVQLMHQMPETSIVRHDFMLVFVRAFRVVWAVTCGLAGLAFFLTAFSKPYSLDVALDPFQALGHEKPKRDPKIENDVETQVTTV